MCRRISPEQRPRSSTAAHAYIVIRYRMAIILGGSLCQASGRGAVLEASGALRASNDHIPAPTEIRKSSEHSIAKSVRASLTIYQNPWLARNSSGIFVVA